jgi:hypothetical protein
VVGHHREGGDLHAQEPGARLQAVPDPVPAVVVRVAGEGIGSAKEGPAYNSLNTVIDPNLILDQGHDLRTIPLCHDEMPAIGPRRLSPVVRRSTFLDYDRAYRSGDLSIRGPSVWYPVGNVGGPLSVPQVCISHAVLRGGGDGDVIPYPTPGRATALGDPARLLTPIIRPFDRECLEAILQDLLQ